MATFDIEIHQTITTIVTIEADNYEEALESVQRRDYELPARHEWDNIGWAFFAPKDENDEYVPPGPERDALPEWSEE